MLYFFYRTSILLVKVIPRGVVQLIASTIGFLYFLLDRKKAFVTRNIKNAIGGISFFGALVIASRLYMNFARNFADYFELFAHDIHYFKALIDFADLDDRIERALDEEKGLIVVSLHIGNWELAGHLCGSFGKKVHGIGLVQPDPRVEKLYEELRSKGNVVVHPLSTGAISVYKALKKNEIAAIVSDRDINHQGLPAKFFNRCVKFPGGAALLSYKTGAKCFVGCLVRVGKGYKVEMSEEIKIDKGKSESEYISAFVQKVAAFTEQLVMKYPDQWFHFFDYFKEYSC